MGSNRHATDHALSPPTRFLTYFAILSAILPVVCNTAAQVTLGSDWPFTRNDISDVATGVVAAFIARAVLVRSGLEHHVGPVWLFYPSTVTLCACTLWEVFFR